MWLDASFFLRKEKVLQYPFCCVVGASVEQNVFFRYNIYDDEYA